MSQRLNHHAPTVEYGLRKWIVVLGIVLAPLLETIDSSIVNVALPAIEGNLGATLDQAAWIVTGYLVANVCVIPLTPWLQTRFGRRQYFAGTIVGFTLASMLCGLADSIGMLIICRVVQGLFGGGLIATSQSALRDTFPPEEVSASQGAFAVVVIVGPIIAPMLGGYIVDAASWQWVFFINLLPGVVSALIVGTMLRNPGEPRPARVDLLGIALLAASLGSLQYVLDEGERHDWFGSDAIVVAAITSAIAGAAFVAWELWGTNEPIVDLRVLRYRSVWVGSILAMGIAATFFGTVFVLPQYVQNLLGFTALESGRLLLFRAAPVMFMIPVIGATVGTGRLDARLAMGGGFLLSAFSSLSLAGMTTSGTDFGHLAFALIFGGVGGAMLFIPLLIVVQSTTASKDAPAASAFITLAFQLGGSMTGATMVTLLDRRAQFHNEMLAGSMTLANPNVQAFLQHASVSQLYRIVLEQSQTMAFADTSFLVGAFALLMIPLVAVMRRQPRTLSQVTFE
jgi:MFS transporter, DHA2 family, multidrug resistance protein